MPLLCLQQSKEKKLVLKERGANSHQESPPLIENKAIMWTCTVSAPEMNIVLHDIIDLPLYHVNTLPLFTLLANHNQTH